MLDGRTVIQKGMEERKRRFSKWRVTRDETCQHNNTVKKRPGKFRNVFWGPTPFCILFTLLSPFMVDYVHVFIKIMIQK